MEGIALHIEALIFASEAPIRVEELRQVLESTFKLKFEKTYLENQIEKLIVKYQSDNYAFELKAEAKGYHFLSKSIYHETIDVLLRQKSRKKLSKASLETLAVVAYRQPVTKSEIERVRGVSCDYTIQKLLEKELITIKGRSEDVGRPLIYATSNKFMQHFGINSLKDLPKLKEFKKNDNEIGTDSTTTLVTNSEYIQPTNLS
jgi:segregation and condensation protein B